jgi:hypothetical protein
MEYQKYPQYTKNYTNVLLDIFKPLTKEQWRWLQNHDGGYYYIHRNGTAVKFERKEDAEWFVLRWL